ncbi:uncharacterized protein N7477_003185 [Penicillium maclennaniae]|uniref:uncharacterized protein n=1 Tax=Penicillium maclennaniae TaxID=1343394 RepID=UPI00254049A2|nr:uncharacterized protein N7477_003185 [Penicillium maclennaniae]KAJ5677552.1 hypothetical protein N7477_003185 [Penicillium maclennaniae]
MFVRAVGFHPNATVWLQGTQKFDLKDDRLMENVFANFGTAKDQRYNSTKQHPTLSSNTTKKGAQQQSSQQQTSRQSSQQSSQQSGYQQKDYLGRQQGHQASQTSNNQGGSRSKWFCTFHNRKSAHTSEQCFLNPANAGKSFNKGTTTAKATAELPTSPEDIFINTANVQIDSIDISTISTANASLNPLRWMLDSGASHHITPNRHAFIEYSLCRVPVKAANGKRFYTQGLGTVNLTTLGKDGQIISSIILKNVWHAEDLENSLISCRTMFRDDSIACTLSDHATLTKVSSGEVVGYGDADNDLYWLRTDSKHQLETFYTSATFTTSATASVVRAMPMEVKPISMDLAHRRFCYIGEQRVRRMPAFAEGIKLIKGSALKTLCPPCLAGKGDSLHINVWGPISIATKEGETYFISITDEASRFC